MRALCQVRRTSYMETHATCTKSSCLKEYLYRGYVQQYTKSRQRVYRYNESVACTNMHNSSLIMHVHVTMFVSVCTISTRLVYCMPHTCITIWYVQVYCVLECVRICHYDDVGLQVHVCNNACSCTICELKIV